MLAPRALALLTSDTNVPSSDASQSPDSELLIGLQEGRFADVLSSQSSRDLLHVTSSADGLLAGAPFLALLKEQVEKLSCESSR